MIFTYFRQIYLKEIPYEEEEMNTDTTSKIVDVDKAIENGNGTGPFKKIQTSLKRIQKPSLPSTGNTQAFAEDLNKSSVDKKNSKEKCKIM